MAGELLAKAIKNNRRKESDLSDLVYGQVTSVTPLKIRVDNRFEIGSPFIELSRTVQELSVAYTTDQISISKGTVAGVSVVTNVSVTPVTKKAQVFRSLRVGDKVKMLRVQKSQKYLVLERG